MQKLTLALAFFAALGSQAALATDVALTDSMWHPFDVSSALSNSGGAEWIDESVNYDGSALSFSFSGPAILTVVDGGFAGDQFQVFDNGVALGFTSTASNSYPNSLALDFDAALTDSNYSRGVYSLGAGDHVITGLLSVSALDDTNTALNATVGGVRVVPVPEADAYALMLLGMGLVGFFARRAK